MHSYFKSPCGLLVPIDWLHITCIKVTIVEYACSSTVMGAGKLHPSNTIYSIGGGLYRHIWESMIHEILTWVVPLSRFHPLLQLCYTFLITYAVAGSKVQFMVFMRSHRLPQLYDWTPEPMSHMTGSKIYTVWCWDMQHACHSQHAANCVVRYRQCFFLHISFPKEGFANNTLFTSDRWLLAWERHKVGAKGRWTAWDAMISGDYSLEQEIPRDCSCAGWDYAFTSNTMQKEREKEKRFYSSK